MKLNKLCIALLLSNIGTTLPAAQDTLDMTVQQIQQLDSTKLTPLQLEDLLIIALFSGEEVKRQAAQHVIDTIAGKQDWPAMIQEIKTGLQEQLNVSTIDDPTLAILLLDMVFSGSKVKRDQAKKSLLAKGIKKLQTAEDFSFAQPEAVKLHTGTFIQNFMQKIQQQGKAIQQSVPAGTEETFYGQKKQKYLNLVKKST